MSISGVGASWQPPNLTDKQNLNQNFGALVSKTFDIMNSASNSAAMVPVDKQTFGAAVVSKTFDYMNSDPGFGKSGTNDMSQTYDFAKNVLGAYAKGSIVNTFS
jgi:hypothetical protein